jgi:hypothetical protein
MHVCVHACMLGEARRPWPRIYGTHGEWGQVGGDAGGAIEGSRRGCEDFVGP